MTTPQKQLIIVAATIIVLLLVALLYLMRPRTPATDGGLIDLDLDDLGEGVKEQVADVTGVVWEAWPGKTPVSIDEEPTPVEETGPPAWAVS